MNNLLRKKLSYSGYFLINLDNGCMIYVDMLTGENLQSFQLDNMYLIHWSVHSSSKRGRDGVNESIVIQPAASITLIEYMKIWCNIQVIIIRLYRQTKIIVEHNSALVLNTNLFIKLCNDRKYTHNSIFECVRSMIAQ